MSTSATNVDPNLRLTSDRAQMRYPSPFFDISQQYVPPTIKELFKWVYFYATNNSFLGPALDKIARYPITDLIFEDQNQNIVGYWKTLLNNRFQIKTFQMEVNLDLVTYGNAFVTIHYPFSRFLQCRSCQETYPWKTARKKIVQLKIKLQCMKCRTEGEATIKDFPYKSAEGVRLVRINPEFIDIKYNDASGRHTYLYSIPEKLKKQITAGDQDILEDTPLIYIEAIKQRKKIKLSSQNLFHLKRPTLAGKDMGWGMPLIARALKDLYYFYTLRRGQEAIINEHIIPFDIIFPQASGRYDPYVHSDLTSWKAEIQRQLAAKRKDPNYKAVLPFPVGFERIGGDGKALMLTPELDFLAKAIIGSAGIPQEFVFGGTMQWTGSSVSLRTLENDFLHHRSQLLQMVIWLIERMRLYLGITAPKTVKFSDFKMADDIQKLQLLQNMAQAEKLDWESILKEMGYDPLIVRRKIEDQKQFEMKIAEMTALRQAETQGKAQQVQMRFQAQQQQAQMSGQAQMAGQAQPQDPSQQQPQQQGPDLQAWVERLSQMSPEEQSKTLQRISQSDPEFAQQLSQAMAGGTPQAPAAPEAGQPNVVPMAAPAAPQPGPQVDMRPLPEQRAPRRQGGV